MSWSYGQEVVAHEAAYAAAMRAAMREKEDGRDYRDPNVAPSPRVPMLLPCA